MKAIAAASVETKSHVWVVQRAKNVEFFRKQIKTIQSEIQGIKTSLTIIDWWEVRIK